MTLEALAALIAATVIISLSPGPAVLLVLGHASAHGWRRTLWSVLGILLADGLLLALVLLGVGAIVQASATAFMALKWAGVAYLIYLGVKQIRAAGQGASANAQTVTKRASGPGLFREALIVSLLNPKAIAFMMAFFPQFVDPASATLGSLVLIGAVFLAAVGAVKTGYALLGGGLRNAFQTAKARRAFDRAGGGALIAAGLATAAASRS